MAASTANMVKSKSGKMYEASSPQGKMIVTAATTGKDADFNSSTDSSTDSSKMDMLQTLQAIYEETQESSDTLDEIEVHLDDDDNPLDDARDNLKASNKDKKKFRLAEGLKKAAGGVQAGFGKVKESLSGKLGLALLGGGLLLLNKYGDEIAGPDGWLTKFLKYMKQDFIPDIRALYETVTGEGGLTEKLKKDFDDAWAGMTGFLAFFSEIGTTIATYVKKFDTNGDGILSGDEAKVMWTEIWDSIKSSLWKLTKDSAIALVSAIGLISIGKAALVTLFKAGTGLAPIAGGVASLGVLGTAALVGVVAAGLWLLTEKVSDAYKDAITDESGNRENFKVKEFLSRFFGGNDDEGGFFNSLTTGLKSAVIGGAAGAAYGSIVPGVGTAVGAAVGALIFGVIGVTGGAAGKNKIKTWLDSFEIAYDNTIDSLTGAFDKLVVAAKAVITPGVSVADAMKNYDATKFSGGQQGANNAQKMLSERIQQSRLKIQELKGKYYYNNGSVQAGIDLKEIKKLHQSIQNDVADKKLIPGYQSTEADIAAANDAAAFSKTMDSVKSSITSVSSLGFRATNFALKDLPRSITDVSLQDLHRFAFEGSMFERDFKAEGNAELIAAQRAGYALGGSIPGSDKGNIADYREMLRVTKLAGTSQRMPKITPQMIANYNSKLLQKEMRADAAKENKFTTFTSQDQRTSTQINNANYVSNINARNDMWLHNDQLRTALGYK